MLRDDIVRLILSLDENTGDKVLPPMHQNEEDIQTLEIIAKKIASESNIPAIDENLYTYVKKINEIVAKSKEDNKTDTEQDYTAEYITDTVEFYKEFLSHLLFEDPSKVVQYESVKSLMDSFLAIVQDRVEKGKLPKRVYVNRNDIPVLVAEIVNEAKADLTSDIMAQIETLALETEYPELFRDVYTTINTYAFAIDKLFPEDAFDDEIELNMYLAERDLLLTEVAEQLLHSYTEK